MGATVPNNYYLFANVSADPDVLLLDFYDGYGAFTAGFPTAATTVQLTGVESGYDTCGACVLVFADLTQGAVGARFIATAGELQLTSVSQTSLAGTLNNVTLTQVNIDEMTLATSPHPDGCSTTIASVPFSAVPMAEPAQFTGEGKTKFSVRIPRLR